MYNLQFTRPIFDSPKSVSFMWPSEVISKLDKEKATNNDFKLKKPNQNLSTIKLLRDVLVRFEVSVNDAIAVDVLQSQHCLSKVHSGHLEREAAHVLDEGGHITALNVLHYHVEVFL